MSNSTLWSRLISEVDADTYAIVENQGLASKFHFNPEFRNNTLKRERFFAFGVPILWGFLLAIKCQLSLPLMLKVPSVILLALLCFLSSAYIFSMAIRAKNSNK